MRKQGTLVLLKVWAGKLWIKKVWAQIICFFFLAELDQFLTFFNNILTFLGCVNCTGLEPEIEFYKNIYKYQLLFNFK